MELHFPSFHILSAFILFLVVVLRTQKRSKTGSLTPNLPPGPWKLPLIGNIHQLVGSLPHHALRDLAKKYGPLMHLQLGEVSTIVVSSSEIAKEVMKSHDIIFAQRPHILATRIMSYNSTNIAFAPYGDYWRHLRKICMSELLSANRVQSFQSIRNEEESNLVRSISLNTGSPINLTEKTFASICAITTRAAFGKKCKYQETFISVLLETIKLAGGFNVGDIFPSFKSLHLISGMRPKLEKLHQEADKILENIIHEHKARGGTTKIDKDEPDEDLVDVLLKFHEDHGDHAFSLTTDNIKAVLLDIFGAGSEPSSTTIDFAMSEMMRNPRIMRKAQEEVRRIFDRKEEIDEMGIQELKFLKLVIKETLRLHPPLPLLLPRECREKCEIDGHEIPVKSKIIVNAWAIGRDPKHWTEPESFNPERFLDSSIDYKGTNFEYIPFGAGRRICPGILFGLASVELLLAKLLYHFDWKLPNGMKQQDLDMTEVFGLAVRRKEDLYLIPTAYYPLSHE
ncbi:hypothetical protein AAG906_010279 [Vitis piasezkii]